MSVASKPAPSRGPAVAAEAPAVAGERPHRALHAVGDWIALLLWLAAFVLLALMAFSDLVHGLFRGPVGPPH